MRGRPQTEQDARRDDLEDANHDGGGRTRSRLLRDAAWVLGTYVVLGVVGGLVWWLLVDPAMFTKGEDGGLGMGELQLSKRFNADGWYVVIAAVLGILSGGVLTWWRSRDFLVTTGLLLIGSAIAAAVTSVVGRWVGPADPASLVKQAGVGDQLPTQLELTANVCYLVWPIAVLAGALFVLWSPPAETTDEGSADPAAEPSSSALPTQPRT